MYLLAKLCFQVCHCRWKLTLSLSFRQLLSVSCFWLFTFGLLCLIFHSKSSVCGLWFLVLCFGTSVSGLLVLCHWLLSLVFYFWFSVHGSLPLVLGIWVFVPGLMSLVFWLKSPVSSFLLLVLGPGAFVFCCSEPFYYGQFFFLSLVHEFVSDRFNVCGGPSVKRWTNIW